MIFHVFEFIPEYIYDIFVFTKGDWKDHVHTLELILGKLKVKGLQCNIEEYFFKQTEMEYLGF